MSKFFIERPILAWVIALIILLVGTLSVLRLPISMYPNVAPPTVSVNAVYPGASAKVVEDSVVQIIEQNLKGLDGLLYFNSASTSSGSASLNLTFKTGTNPDTAQVQVQNKLQSVTPLLPQEVQRQGISVTKSGDSFLMVLAFYSEDGSMNPTDIGDYLAASVVDQLARVPGVGNVQLFGAKYAMRIWLDPNKLDTFQLSPSEVAVAVRAQNAQIALGQLGETPAVQGTQIYAPITAQDRLQTPEQFRNIIVRSGNDGSILRLGDVARIELGAESYGFVSRYNGKNASGIAINLATGANALDTAEGVNAAIAQLQPHFPKGLKTEVAYDTTPFVKVSIKNVIKTLLEAIVLVFFVMYLFMQNFRATLIPTIAIPVVLLGTFGVLLALGFTINMLTMFAMVLAIGLLVDDAIVVVENVERLMTDEGLSPLEATRKSMHQITGALVGIGIVLSAVFVPMAFMDGSTGIIYRQFSATIVSAMALSVLIAIVLTPALCANILLPVKKGEHHGHGKFFTWFNNKFDQTNKKYQTLVARILRFPGRYLAIYAALVLAMVVLFVRLPSSFLPDEDQGMLFGMITAPPGATQERTLHALAEVEDFFLEKESGTVRSLFTVQGFSFMGSGQNNGMAFVRLKDWSERHGKDNSAQGVAMRGMMSLMGTVTDAQAYVMAPPAMPELGTSSGFEFYLKDNNGSGHAKLLEARNMLLGMAMQNKKLTGVRPSSSEDAPTLRVDIDPQRVGALNLTMDQINATLSTAWGGAYLDDFIDRGRVKRVYMQADAPFRMSPDNFALWKVKNNLGQMVPFSAFATTRWEFGPQGLDRFNGVGAMGIQGQGAPGVSSGDAMAEIEAMATKLPQGFTVDWTGLSYQERQAGSQTTMLYILSLLIVFLCLAALYESWAVPTAVLLVAPLGILGAALGNTMFGMSRDVYFQVAMLTTVGLTSKNAILIVEFAKTYYEEGMELIEATLHAIRDRLRPILMTSMAFGLGVLPLAMASGAGSGAQRAIGTGVLGGMIVGTFLGIFFVPLFFVVIEKLINARKPHPAGKTQETPNG